MNSLLLRNIIRFILLAAIQVFIFDRINLSGYINPYIYVLFILMLPFDISGWLLLLSAFIMGMTIDLFSHTPGIHAAASVFMAFARPGVIRLVGKQEDVQPGQFPNIRETGVPWFFSYTVILVFLHHLALFFIEIFRFNEFFITLLKVLINTGITTLIILIIQFLFYSRKSE